RSRIPGVGRPARSARLPSLTQPSDRLIAQPRRVLTGVKASTRSARGASLTPAARPARVQSGRLQGRSLRSHQGRTRPLILPRPLHRARSTMPLAYLTSLFSIRERCPTPFCGARVTAAHAAVQASAPYLGLALLGRSRARVPVPMLLLHHHQRAGTEEPLPL